MEIDPDRLLQWLFKFSRPILIVTQIDGALSRDQLVPHPELFVQKFVSCKLCLFAAYRCLSFDDEQKKVPSLTHASKKKEHWL